MKYLSLSKEIKNLAQKNIFQSLIGFFRKNFLFFTVFVTGAGVLVIEVVAMRVLAPYYGNTIFTASSVITVILAALSIGYYLGGRFSDKNPSSDWFFKIVFLSGFFLLLFYLFGVIILPLLSFIFSIILGPLISSLVLFFFPALLLGTLSPYAIKLQSIYFPEQGVGTIAGKVFFWSTLGSIVGSLSAGFVLIPNFGIRQIIITTGVALFFLGFLPLIKIGSDKKKLHKIFIAFFVIIAGIIIAEYQTDKNIVYIKDGVYEKITIRDGEYKNRPVRFFQQDHSMSGGMFLDSDDPADLVFDYTKYYLFYKIFTPSVKDILVVGGGAYSIPKAMLQELPLAAIDVSEIEPSLFNLAKKYFKAADNPRLHNYTEDGRRLLAFSDKKYDMIFSDVYFSLYSVPVHFTTQEFFKIVKEKLNEDGILVINIIGDLSQDNQSLIMSEIKTIQTVFNNSYFFAVKSPEAAGAQNIIIVGYNSDKRIDFNSSSVANHQDPFIRDLKNKIISVDKFDLSSQLVLTDNFSPVEYLTAKVLSRKFGN
jgi:spermidine synthase